MEKNIIPICFAIDDAYTPFLAVALQSLIDNASKEYNYCIKVLHTNVKEEHMKQIKKYENEYVNIEFVDLNYYLEKVKDKLYTRDYYTNTTYFRLFLPELYPQYDKILYLDSDITIVGDISELYNTDMGTNLVAAAPDDIIQYNKVFQDYAELVVGVESYTKYFNAGVLLMNLDQLRKFKFQEKFIYLLTTVRFSVAQDQDYLNRLCKGRVTLVDRQWDCMPLVNATTKREDIKLVHYNFAYKPWHFEDVLYKEFFWEYAKKTEFYDEILKIQSEYTEEQKFKDREAEKSLRLLAEKENSCVGDDRSNQKVIDENLKKIEKSKDRLEILEKIKQLFSTLTIFVPELPDNSFSAELWNVESEVPYTALRVKNSNDVMGYGVNKEFLIPSNEIPKYPIVVVKLNERVVSVNKAQRNLSPMSIINPDIVFFSDVFDNTENASSVIQNRNFSSGDTRDRTGSIPENMKKVYEAYDVFAATNEWPRDYIYYGLTPQQPKGPFNRDFKESLVYFKLLGDPRTVMNKICDQSEDPRIDGNTHQETGGGCPGGSTILTPWTDGSLEFIVKVYVANQAGIGNEYINNFIVKPSALFKITPKDPLSSKFEVKSIELTDGIALDLPLFE